MTEVLLAAIVGFLITLVIQVYAAAIVLRCMPSLLARFPHSFLGGIGILATAVLILFAASFLQIVIWATLFLFSDNFESFRNAVYHSAVNFSTLGYGDIVMTGYWKLLGPLEAVNGVLMLGLSAAILSSVLQRITDRIVSLKE
ncbi:ion channel [Alkalilimnicola ehrlichii]|uniref:Potassium channel domain-containing protein n=1 Tax=Alkalilimnicola ehrlichii TaxID=351052 RepID=A0A3E0WLP2_9GAMM|nr:ion channel [Alkalilimnicola ehrlichii]RFA32855.1 hypothetical protein CAL65_18850 [Alkalilimnicola ehrlichii]